MTSLFPRRHSWGCARQDRRPRGYAWSCTSVRERRRSVFLCFSSDEKYGCPSVGVSCPIAEAQHQLPGRDADGGPSFGTWASRAAQWPHRGWLLLFASSGACSPFRDLPKGESTFGEKQLSSHHARPQSVKKAWSGRGTTVNLSHLQMTGCQPQERRSCGSTSQDF